MKISIFGIGYVGAVSAACLAEDGHTVLGVDPAKGKVDAINQGCSPIIEKDIGELISKNVKAGRLIATTNTEEVIAKTDISFVCVGTPSQLNGNLDLKHIRKVCEEIGKAIKNKSNRHVVVIRSTCLPGTMRNLVIPALEEASGKTVGKDFGVCSNPEFLREGTAVYDYYNPPKIVIGEIDKESGDLIALIYEKLKAPLIRSQVEVAEMIKYVDNVWHGLKVGFANEIGNICKELDIDSHTVMNIFCQDTKLNISPYYMKPGFAFGGSCLPKDLRALTYKARSLDLNLPILNSILISNELQVDRGLNMVMAKGKKKIGVLGFSFKAGTDDLRESPVVELIERLIGKGYEVKIYDNNVKLSSLIGANRDFILNTIPHISRLMVDSISDIINHAETIIIGNSASEFKNILELVKPEQNIIDLVRICENKGKNREYDGICW
ncbi:MAG: nucleotide sugar dehydrogenase [Candidatus Omnitrophota bacterium]